MKRIGLVLLCFLLISTQTAFAQIGYKAPPDPTPTVEPVATAAVKEERAQVTPLEEADMGSYMYEYRLADAEISLMLPISIQTELLLDEPYQKCVLLMNPEFPMGYLAFFAIHAEFFEGIDLASLDDEGMVDFLQTISNYPERTSWEVMEDFAEVKAAVRVFEDGREEGTPPAEHLVYMYGEWVLNAMLQRFDGVAEMPEDILAWQEELLYSAVSYEGMTSRLSAYTLPGSDVTIALPENMVMRQMADFDDFQWLTIAERTTGIEQYLLYLYANYDEGLVGKTAAELDEETLDELMKGSIHNYYDEGSGELIKDFVAGEDVWTYTVQGARQLLTVKDGWSIIASYISSEEPSDIEAAQEALMKNILGEETEIPSMTGV